MSFKYASCCLLGLAFLLPSELRAQQHQSRPDVSSVTLPDMTHSRDPDVLKEGWKYFFFHKDGVSYDEAYEDIADCYNFLTPSGWDDVSIPRFIPWGKASTRTKSTPFSNSLMAAAFSATMEKTLHRRDRQSKMRRCMETRSYIRYSVPQNVWEQVTALPADQAIAVQAKLAAGPAFGETPTK